MTRTSPSPGVLRVYCEEGARRTFVMALDWPGWGRAARTTEAALEAFEAYAPRYAPVATAAGLDPPARVGAGAGEGGFTVDVVARVPGNATTDYGAPGVVPPLDADGWTGDAWRDGEVQRATALLEAAWAYLDQAVAAAPASLRKGPRGGGRDRDAVLEHVLSTEPAYARKAGLRGPAPTDRAGHDALRAELLTVLRAGEGRAPAASGWPAPDAVRRLARHALDHAGEIEDRAQP